MLGRQSCSFLKAYFQRRTGWLLVSRRVGIFSMVPHLEELWLNHPSENISQIGSFPQIGMNIKFFETICNHLSDTPGELREPWCFTSCKYLKPPSTIHNFSSLSETTKTGTILLVMRLYTNQGSWLLLWDLPCPKIQLNTWGLFFLAFET